MHCSTITRHRMLTMPLANKKILVLWTHESPTHPVCYYMPRVLQVTPRMTIDVSLYYISSMDHTGESRKCIVTRQHGERNLLCGGNRATNVQHPNHELWITNTLEDTNDP